MSCRDKQRTHLSLEIFTHKLQGVVQCMDCSQLDLIRRFLFACSVDYGSKNLIRADTENLRFLGEIIGIIPQY